ncbi:MAG: Na/Pi cotransporter family protein [Clostridia bacterium]|nr:Na/Pi cotransporter family protein [Clostridia bacterium]
MGINEIFDLLAGLALFLFGMNTMSHALEQIAGNQMKAILSKLTSNKLKGFLLGLGVTAIIQSSSATTVMVVGFVNSGVMTLAQSVGIIIGANMGAAVTPLIISLSSAGGGQSFSVVGFLSAAMAITGVLFYVFLKGSNRRRNIGLIMLGFAVLMIGMDIMSGSVSGLRDNPTFTGIITMFENPVMAILVGTVFTAIIQSSAASIGILQALTATGAITNTLTVPILMGQNIGTCVSAMISSVGASKNAKRTAIVHLTFNVISALILGTIYCVIYYAFNRGVVSEFLSTTSTPFAVAIINVIYKVLSILILMPVSGLLEKIACLVIREGKQYSDVEMLDDRLLTTTAVAVQRASDVAETMAGISFESMKMSLRVLENYDRKVVDEIEHMENEVDIYEDKLGSYLVKLSAQELSAGDAREVSKLLHVLSDIERISDHSVNVIRSAAEMNEKKLTFSAEAKNELKVLTSALGEIIDMTANALLFGDMKSAVHVEPLEEVIDSLRDSIKDNHVRRLQNSECTIEMGFILSDLLTTLSRVSDHCSNIAGCVIEIQHNSLDVHGYLGKVKQGAEDFDAYYAMYEKKYALHASADAQE